MIELDVTRPAADERAGVEVFYATDTRRIRRLDRVSPYHLLGAGEFGFRTRECRCRFFTRRSDVAIMAVALDWLATRFANRLLKRSDGLLLRSGSAGHMKNFFFQDSAMQIVHAVTE